MTSALFDSAAEKYDENFTNTEIGKLQRARVWNYLNTILPNNSLNILELNCGTGEDAIWFAKRGHRVLATDISEKMISITRAKVDKLGLSDKISVEILNINEIDKLASNKKFDIVFSNFGGLNCLNETEICVLSNKIKNLLSLKGKFIAVVMPDFCMIESIYFLSKFKIKEMLRRKKMQKVNVNDTIVKTYYYNPKSFYRFFKNDFFLNKVIGVGLTIPPTYLNSFFKKKAHTLKLLNGTENLIGNNLFTASISDHYLIDLCINK